MSRPVAVYVRRMFARASVLWAVAVAACSSPAPAPVRPEPASPATPPTTSVTPEPSRTTSLGEQVAKTRSELRELTLDLRTADRSLYRALPVDPEGIVARRA